MGHIVYPDKERFNRINARNRGCAAHLGCLVVNVAGGLNPPEPASAKAFLKLLASGMMGILIPAFLFAVAQTRITSSVAGILNTLTPAFTMVVGVMFFRQRFRWISAAGLLLAWADR